LAFCFKPQAQNPKKIQNPKKVQILKKVQTSKKSLKQGCQVDTFLKNLRLENFFATFETF
jgi:hypothetical protein